MRKRSRVNTVYANLSDNLCKEVLAALSQAHGPNAVADTERKTITYGLLLPMPRMRGTYILPEPEWFEQSSPPSANSRPRHRGAP